MSDYRGMLDYRGVGVERFHCSYIEVSNACVDHFWSPDCQCKPEDVFFLSFSLAKVA